MKKLVLLLNMGGADDLSQVKVFLKNMFNDPYILGAPQPLRGVLAALITQMRLKPATKNYKALGGKSPIGDLTRELIAKLNASGDGDFIFDYAMNYTPPFAIDTLKKHTDANEIILFALYPHFSQTTIQSSVDSALSAIKELKITPKITILPPFYENDQFNEIIVNDIISVATEPQNTHLIFSAHSLPQRIIDNGDLYEKHLKNHVQILSDKLSNRGINFAQIHLAYQSRLGPIKWLGPNLSDILPILTPKKAVIYPISFCVDNSETDFELAIEYAHIAKQNSFELYEVIKAPNARDKFAKFIKDFVAAH